MRRTIILLLLFLLVIITAALYARYWPMLQPVDLQALLAHNPWAPVIFVLAHIVISLAFIPRTILSIVAGAVFGLWLGILVNMIGAMAGCIAGFMLVRYLNRGLFALDGKHRLTWLAGVKQRLDGGGWRGVALVRMVPVVPHSASNYALGLTQISFEDYCLGSLVGLLPTTIMGVGIGAAGGQALAGSGNWLLPTLIGLAALAASALLPRLLERLRRR